MFVNSPLAVITCFIECPVLPTNTGNPRLITLQTAAGCSQLWRQRESFQTAKDANVFNRRICLTIYFTTATSRHCGPRKTHTWFSWFQRNKEILVSRVLTWKSLRSLESSLKDLNNSTANYLGGHCRPHLRLCSPECSLEGFQDLEIYNVISLERWHYLAVLKASVLPME